MATSSWRRSLGSVSSFLRNYLGGLRGGSILASWVVARTLAYFLWVKPQQDLKREQEVQWFIPDPLETGLMYCKKKGVAKPEGRLFDLWVIMEVIFL